MKYPNLKDAFEKALLDFEHKRGKRFTIRQIAQMISEPEQSVYRWFNGLSIPSDPDVRDKLVKLLGPDILIPMRLTPPDIDPKFLRLVYAAETDENIKRLLDDALDAAKKYQSKEQVGQLQLIA